MASQKGAVLARLARGEEDSLVNLFLFGTSYTAEPRLTPAFLGQLDREWKGGSREAEERLARAYRQRASDLVNAASSTAADERMRFARSVLERQGFGVARAEGHGKAEAYLLGSVVRVQQEAAALTRELDAARRQADSTAAFAERSRLFRERGVAPDSSVMTQYAVDQAILAARERGLLQPGRVRRIAIVGPGLDFVDKQEGYDFYPPQSLQPFATIDSLLRSGLVAAARDVSVTTLDVSPRVNAHLRAAVDRARKAAAPYQLVLPLDSAGGWLADAAAFWRTLGDRVGTATEVRVPRELPSLRARGVAVAPRVVERVGVRDCDIVYDRFDLPAPELFDLVIATNVFVYYDTFEQSLALANVASMLRPGGLLICNNSLLEIPEIPMRSASYVTVRFSGREGDGEHMVFYQRQ
jgi:SAM-dependent methyltransferase